MTADACPRCGAEMAYDDPHYMRFACGAVMWRDGTTARRDYACYQRQLAAQAAEIERLEFESAVGRQLIIWLRKGATITGSPTCLTRDVNGDIQGELTIKYPEGEVK